MEEGIEIYVRHSSGKAMLTIYVPDSQRESLMRGLAGGQVAFEVPAHLEMSSLPQWITDDELRAKLANETVHLRIPIGSVTVNQGS